MKVEIGDFVHDHNSEEERVVKVHVDEWDTWNCDQTIAIVVLPLLKKLREDKRGVPGDLYHEIEESYANYRATFTQEEFEKHIEETATACWQELMDAMIWSFGEAVDNYCSLAGEHGRDYNNYQNRLQHGFQAFGKYFTALWI